MMRKVWLPISLALGTLHPLSVVSAQELAVAPKIDSTLVPYASVRESVRLPDSRTLHFVCMGKGSPIVLLAAGGPGWSIDWRLVQPAVAAKTRVCSWDRAGLGLSSPSPKPQSVDNTTADLVAALKAGGISGPYVMVGHSTGGFDGLFFADRHPSDVVGMVLVDPTPLPDSPAQVDRTPIITAMLRTDPPFVAFLEKCAIALRTGRVRPGGDDPDGCLAPVAWPPEYPDALRTALDKQKVNATPEAIATAMDNIAFYSSAKLLAQDLQLTVNPRRNYGNMPLVVLSAGKDGASSDQPAALNAELAILLGNKQRAHAKYASLSRRGVHRIVADSDHDIPHAAPQTVADAVNAVVDEARRSQVARRPAP